MRTAVIVGVDPGTTIGLAVLDLHGTVITLASSRNISLDQVMIIITEKGKPIIIATDKKQIPEYVRSIGAAFNAAVYAPPEDTGREEKRILTNSYLYSNDHEMDALACALLAYKHYKPLFIRIDQVLQEQQKQQYSSDVKSYLVRYPEVNISLALEHIESKNEYHKERLQRVVEKRQTPKDIAYFERKISELNRENFLLKEDKASLYKTIDCQKIELEYYKKKDQAISTIIDQKLIHKKKLLKYLQKKLDHSSKKIREVSKECELLHHGLLHFDEYVLCKRLETLGSVKDLSHIREHDILLVDNLTSVSDQTLELLTSKIQIILYKGILPRSLQSLPFHFIPVGDMKILEFREFTLCDKETYRRKKSSLDYLKIALQEFENERSKNR